MRPAPCSLPSRRRSQTTASAMCREPPSSWAGASSPTWAAPSSGERDGVVGATVGGPTWAAPSSGDRGGPSLREELVQEGTRMQMAAVLCWPLLPQLLTGRLRGLHATFKNEPLHAQLNFGNHARQRLESPSVSMLRIAVPAYIGSKSPSLRSLQPRTYTRSCTHTRIRRRRLLQAEVDVHECEYYCDLHAAIAIDGYQPRARTGVACASWHPCLEHSFWNVSVHMSKTNCLSIQMYE